MGCGSSKDLPIELREGLQTPPAPEEETQVDEDAHSSPDHYSENITSPDMTKQNGTTNNLSASSDDRQSLDEKFETRPPSMSESQRAEAIAFEVIDESLIKKHPPKKFQKLEDLQMGPNLTPEELQKKQEIAKERRQSIMNRRIKSARERSAKSAHIKSTTDENGEDGTESIESPEDM